MSPKVHRIKKPEITSFSKLLVRIRIYRKGRNITQEQVASQLGISLRTYQRIEQGFAPLEMETLYNLCKILKVSYEDLAYPSLSEEDIPNVTFLSPEAKQRERSAYEEEIQLLFLNLREELKDRDDRIKDLYRSKLFRDHKLPCFYSDPNFTWINKSLAEQMGHGKVSKISIMKGLSDFHFIIRLWEVCYKRDEPWFETKTEHPLEEGRLMKVTTLNQFYLVNGMPLVFGTVVSKE